MTLQIRDLAFGYDEKPVLTGVELSVEAGELLAVLGPNGSGKTTLLQCINRILEPEGGCIEIDGDRVSNLSRQEAARRVGYVPQDEARAFPATVFETILQGRKPHGGWSPGQADREAVADAIEELGLGSLAMRQVDALSGGQRQKVRLARALVQNPSVLLFDEPTSALDLKHQLDVMELIVEHVRNEDVAALLAIHDLNLAARYCDRVALLREGDVYTVGEPDVLTPETIRSVYNVEATVRQHNGHRVIVPEQPTSGTRQGLLADPADSERDVAVFEEPTNREDQSGRPASLTD
ncbi:MAG: ABC transporter ATP-binding protein [Halodesulfurarchaeum sp.]